MQPITRIRVSVLVLNSPEAKRLLSATTFMDPRAVLKRLDVTSLEIISIYQLL